MKTLFLLLILMASSHADAETPSVRGAGTDSCGNWTVQRKSKSSMMGWQESWVLGFLSALQPANSRSTKVDNGELWTWIDNYCAQHPLDTLADATVALLHTLK